MLVEDGIHVLGGDRGKHQAEQKNHGQQGGDHSSRVHQIPPVMGSFYLPS
ncbi:MAG: hypothetical protein OZSIB_0232 [Candidatus Ozemobacter sibiricus]|uniref:Uncharacterized protein n=1 Tax=Candidatus Ozemobacter sibiricus TaxID=2268124 RepID=A0A367ZLX5_9BACT|nr:MAG: hypothetical protein OZSIB_0232 [Candidatus Ozemobacter sibiricus]